MGLYIQKLQAFLPRLQKSVIKDISFPNFKVSLGHKIITISWYQLNIQGHFQKLNSLIFCKLLKHKLSLSLCLLFPGEIQKYDHVLIVIKLNSL